MMVSPRQRETILELLRGSFTEPGDVVEAGCNAGSTSGLLATVVAGTDRRLHLFDSFDGLPAESGYGGQMAVSQQVLEQNVRQQLGEESLPRFVEVHPGWFADTMPQQLPDHICFAFVDCDVFDSLLDCVPPIMERLTGTLAIHDYTHERWGAGVQRAVELLGLQFTVRDGMAIVRSDEQC
jgi:hypothetical protein